MPIQTWLICSWSPRPTTKTKKWGTRPGSALLSTGHSYPTGARYYWCMASNRRMCENLSLPNWDLISESSTVSSSELRAKALMIKDLLLIPRQRARWQCEKRCRGYKLDMMVREHRSSSWESSNGPSHLTWEPNLHLKVRTSTEKARCWNHELVIRQVTIELM